MREPVGSPALLPVIVPTVASLERQPHLLRAVESIRAQDGVEAVPLVVANGDEVEESVVQTLERDARARVLRLGEANLPRALLAGRRAVDGAYFAELDDDDVLLPGALRARVERLEADPGLAAAVSNGILRGAGPDLESIPDVETVRGDPLRTLLERNWLLPGSAVFRSARVTEDVFARIPTYLEWTWLGVELALRHRIAFLPKPGVVHYLERPFSVDASEACARARPEAIRRLLELPLPGWARRRVRRKVAEEYHGLAERCRGWNDRAGAWRAHLSSLYLPGGWRYLAYTRYLLRSASE